MAALESGPESMSCIVSTAFAEPREAYIVEAWVEINVKPVQPHEEIVRSQHPGNLDQLVRVAVAMEEGLLSEDHRGEHGPEGPHIQRVVVLLEVHEQLGALEVSRGDSDVIFLHRA